MSVVNVLGEFVSRLEMSGLPPAVTEKARLCLLNGYGIALAGLDTPYAPVARAAALAVDGEQARGATLLGDGRKTSMLGAAVANAALFHGRAQEDACGAAHFGAILIPMLTAAVEAGRMPASRLLPALIAGYEVGGLFEAAYSGKTTPAGLRASPIYGALAAAAAASHALALEPARCAAALANAASFAGGILQSFDDGTDEWRYQVGMTARNGWLAAELAAAGSVSAERAIEGRHGFVRAFARVDCDIESLLAPLGRTWSIHRVAFKPYPVCAFNQTPVGAALRLRERLGGAREPARIRVRMNPYETGYAGMDSKGPFSTISGTLMSIPFCIANALLRGAPSLRDMTRYDDGEVNALVERIDLVPDEGVERLCCAIEIEFGDGSAPMVETLNLTAADYSYDRAGVRALVARVGAEVGLPQSLFDDLERFADDPQAAGIGSLLTCFRAAAATAPEQSAGGRKR
jgi:2-methylcitrate dehydratase PrpD